MRSGELADLAQVSIRTLRHYHQIGLLPEPVRSLNGYRDYDGHDLVRVLRIRRLAELGVRLDEIGPMLQGEDTGDSLAALDAALAAQIEQLQARRRLLATLAEAGGAADLPPGVAAYLARLSEAGVSAQTLAAERDVAVLVSHVYGPELGRRLLEASDAVLRDDPGQAPMHRLFAAWDALGDEADDADEETLERGAELFVEATTSLLERLGGDLPDTITPRQVQGQSAIDDLLTPAQRAVIERVGTRLADVR